MAETLYFPHLSGSRWISFLSCLLLLASLSPNCVALGTEEVNTQFVQTVLTVKNGLPQNSVNSLAQTRDGYLWFGTEEGLARYDGLRVTVFATTSHKSLTDNFINALAAGRDGSLWIGTRSCLVQLKNGEFHTYFTAQSPISTIYEAQDGRIWVGSQDGLYSVQGQTTRLYTSGDGLPSNDIAGIDQTADGTLWLGTRKGLASFRNGEFRRYGSREGLQIDPVLALAASQDGSVWIAFASGLVRWKDKPLETVPSIRLPQHDWVNSMRADRTGTIWLGFEHSGVAALRNGKLSTYTAHDGLPSDDVARVFEDRDGHLWVGLAEAGVVELRTGIFSSFGKQEGLSDDMVWSVLQARDRSIWVGTNSKGLNHIGNDGKVRVYTTRDGLPSDSIFALMESRDGSIWIGTEDGALSHFSKGRITVFKDPTVKGVRIASIQEAPDGDLWIAFHMANGLARFHQGRFEHFALPGLPNTTAIAPDGSLWVGTDHAGVSHFQNDVITTYTTRNGLLANFAQAVYVDRDGVVWAGTSPGGLSRIKDGHVTTYSIDQGLFDLTVGAIVEDDSGYLWMTCNKGIYKVSKKELNDYADGRISAIHSIVYGTADGLRNPECNFAADPAVWKGSDGRLWFPTTAGIASVDPNHSQIAISESSPLIEEVDFNQHAVPIGKQVTAGPGGGDLEIQFSDPDFVAPERIRFRYRLQGSDADWVEVGDRRQAFYTKLPPGRYVFEVEGANGPLGWKSKAAQIEIVLLPHFWQTKWFQGLCALLILCICAAVYRLRVRYLVERNRDLEDRVLMRTAELQDALKAAEVAQLALREQATRDDLTGLFNRRSLFELLGKEILRAKRKGLPISLLMADLDHFKAINDSKGHLVGDQVLQEVAARFVRLTRSYDFASRYGGEEFVIVLPGCSLEDGIKRADDFRAAIADTPLSTSCGLVHVTCSFGVAVSYDDISSEELINEADAALYCAKRAGRNRAYAASLHSQAAQESAATPSRP